MKTGQLGPSGSSGPPVTLHVVLEPSHGLEPVKVMGVQVEPPLIERMNKGCVIQDRVQVPINDYSHCTH